MTLPYHFVSPALSAEDESIMGYLQKLPEIGPTIGQAIARI